MRRIVIAALGLAMAASAAAPSMAQESALKWGYDSEPDQPFVDRGPTGDPTGFDVDLMNAMCAEMKTKCEIAITVWDSMIPALESKKIDIIWTGMGITEEREKVINFTDVYRKSPAAYLYPT
ncbi:transporter substrate-binding domain-containing protein, partial [Mesorhizobium sp. M7D.F.Ca.US.004.03.1.1]|uniref:transporter substrate-binding domain-containing protein n=1 Tax=Mesorhizobium sp. M7D.F.Ca.US.004.03.1.1 TaxID=2496702 RepID=UPI000FCAD8F2